MDFNQWSTKKILSLVVVVVLLIFALLHILDIIDWVKMVLGILTPFIIGASIAFVINVPMCFFEEKVFSRIKNRKFKKFERPVAIIVSFLIVLFTVSAVVSIVIPQVVNAIVLFANNIPHYVNVINDWAGEVLDNNQWLKDLLPDDFEKRLLSDKEWQNNIKEFLNQDRITSFFTTVGSTIGATFGFVTSVFGQVTNIVIGFFFAIYILANKELLHVQTRMGVYAFFAKRQAVGIMHVGQVAYQKFYSFITGQMTEAVILGTLCFIGMTILGMPYTTMVSVLVGFASLIPIVGALVAGVVSSLLIMSVDPMKGLIFLIFLVILQQFEGNIIYPRVVGGSVGLPAIWTLVAITLGGTLMGLIGMLTFVPLGATIYTLISELVAHKLEAKGINEASSELKTGLPAGVAPYTPAKD